MRFSDRANPGLAVAGKVGWPRIRCVTFDLDDCLWDAVEVMTRAEEARTELLRRRFPRVTERWPTWQIFRREAMASAAEARPEIAYSPSEVQREALARCASGVGPSNRHQPPTRPWDELNSRRCPCTVECRVRLQAGDGGASRFRRVCAREGGVRTAVRRGRAAAASPTQARGRHWYIRPPCLAPAASCLVHACMHANCGGVRCWQCSCIAVGRAADAPLPYARACTRTHGPHAGTITNGNGDAQAVKGLGPLVDFSVTAESAGAAKPSVRSHATAPHHRDCATHSFAPHTASASHTAQCVWRSRQADVVGDRGELLQARIFDHAVEQLQKLRPQAERQGDGRGRADGGDVANDVARACVHVGDDHEKDCAGAHGAGFRSIWCPAPQAWDLLGPVAVPLPEADFLGAADARCAPIHLRWYQLQRLMS
jgi:FMN phosphatase YigB (HAD superfamily)